jgi:hypothetical protein
MQMDRNIADKCFQGLFYLLCVCYIIFYMPYGLEGSDTGYIFGSSWNIYNGQLPHRDFIYTRPAIPAFFHTIFLFISETYGYVIDRAFFYVQVFFYSYLGAKLLTYHFGITSIATRYFIAIIGALVSIHNYPPMGWNTIDGVFFCMIGMYLLLKKDSKPYHIFFSMLFLVLGVFSKQSFYFMPIFIAGYLLLTKDWYRIKYFVLFGIVWVACYVGFKSATDSLTPFLEQTFHRTESSALLNAGLKNYYLAIKSNVIYVLVAIAATWAVYKFLPKKYGFLLVSLTIAAVMIALYQQENSISVFKRSLLQVLFVFAVIYSVVMLRKDRNFLLLLLLLTLSWSASISNGFKTPIHFSLPIFFSIYYLFFYTAIPSEENKKIAPWIAGTVITAFLITFYIGYQTIYRDAPRSELVYEMDTVFPQLATIKSDKATFEKYSELKALAQQYPNFTVIPTLTLAHYLTKTVNPIGTDWPHDAEVNDQGDQLAKQLAEKKSFVFVEKSDVSEKELNFYEILDSITAQWQLEKETAYFSVYSPPKAK